MQNDIADQFLPDRAQGFSLDSIMNLQAPTGPQGQPLQGSQSASSAGGFSFSLFAPCAQSASASPALQQQQQQQAQQPQQPLVAPPFFGRFSPGILNGTPVKKPPTGLVVKVEPTSADKNKSKQTGGGAGRPKMPVVEKANELVSKWSAASLVDARFYGAEKMAQFKATGRILDELRDVATADEAEPDAARMQKKVHGVLPGVGRLAALPGTRPSY